MGRSSREKPERLGEKLTQVRNTLGLSQNEILSRMELAEKLNRDDISKYERGVREPSLIVILRYARLAGVCLDVLVDDELNLPAKLPAKPKHS
ncbi:MAG TPA: helix-turn-helix transcriptional regulator [Pyrinomonadaceae bacterium]|nr:helix-turn-helix transcriptional regulator [Pyrinomonadaceae bacterium]